MANGNDRDDIPPLPPEDSGAEDRSISLGSARPAVAAAPTKMTVILILAAVFLFFVGKALFFSASPPVEKRTDRKTTAPADNNGQNQNAFMPPIEPVKPQLPPAPPVAPPLPPTTPQFTVTSGPDKNAEAARIHSAMLVGSGNAASRIFGTPKKAAPVAGNDANSAFAQSVADTPAGRSEATRVSNLGSTILQGKFIHAILETAVNTDLPGPLRAIVSHDIYAEAGKAVLIPKGSRIIGVYNPAVRRGQARVFIIWTRVIRPDGVDIMVDSPGVDQLGRSGLGGDVDNKYFEMFSTAILTSTLDIGVAAAGQGLFGNQQTTSVESGSGISTSSSPTAVAMQQAISNVGSVGSAIVNSTLNLAPVITVDQGTPINVFVNKDLSFPSQTKFVE